MQYTQDGREELLTQSFHVNVAPMSSGNDSSFAASRRPSLTSDIHGARRVNSDSVVPGASGTTPRFVNTGRLGTDADMHDLRPAQQRAQSSLGQSSLAAAAAVTTQDAQMMQVLTSAAQRVAQEAQAHVIAARSPNDPPGPQLQALAKQQHVLTVTAQALDHEVSAQHPDSVSPSSNVLVAAAQQVVLQAARQVAADRSVMAAMSLSTGIPVPPSSSAQVTVNEVSVATQTAVAHAVDITGPLSSEVDVMMTASSLLQQQSMNDPSPMGALESIRPHSTGALPPASFPLPSSCAFPAAAPLGVATTDFLTS